MTITRRVSRTELVDYTFEITPEYLKTINRALHEFGHLEFDVNEEDIAKVLKGYTTDERLDTVIDHITVKGDSGEVHGWSENLGDLLNEWVVEDIYDSGKAEIIDGEVFDEWTEIH